MFGIGKIGLSGIIRVETIDQDESTLLDPWSKIGVYYFAKMSEENPCIVLFQNSSGQILPRDRLGEKFLQNPQIQRVVLQPFKDTIRYENIRRAIINFNPQTGESGYEQINLILEKIDPGKEPLTRDLNHSMLKSALDFYPKRESGEEIKYSVNHSELIRLYDEFTRIVDRIRRGERLVTVPFSRILETFNSLTSRIGIKSVDCRDISHLVVVGKTDGIRAIPLELGQHENLSKMRTEDLQELSDYIDKSDLDVLIPLHVEVCTELSKR